MLSEPAMQAKVKPTPQSRSDGYEQFLSQVKANFATVAKRASGVTFTTNAANLFELFLRALPEDARQHYTCNSCRSFFNHFGGLVTIGPNGNLTPLAWSGAEFPDFFRPAVYVLWRSVEMAKVTGVFYTKEATLGHPVTGEWHHLHAAAPAVFMSTAKEPHQASAEKSEEYRMLRAAMAEYTPQNVMDAIALLKSGNLYRPERVLPTAEWLKDLYHKTAGEKNERKDNLVWLAVATAPAGFAHFKGGVLGTLLDDVKAGLPFSAIKARFDSKMDAGNYQRAQVAPDAGNIEQAERIVNQLGIAPSLARRYATLTEVQTIWMPLPKREAKVHEGGVFSSIAAKQKAKPAPRVTAPASVMTWDKFSRTVLPTARSIQAKIPTDSNRFAALVTAQHADAPNILQWDNPFSWYYHNGIDAEMRRRVVAAGGRYDDVDIRGTFIWHTGDDLDLHCVGPTGHISFRQKRIGHGWLDVDANAGGARTRQPVENIRWPKGLARPGRYTFYVHFYDNHETRYGQVPWAVELEVNGRIYRHDGAFSVGDVQHTMREVFSFDYTPGQEPRIAAQSVGTRPSGWSVTPGEFVDVTGIALSPNLWGDNPQPRHGAHTFFLLAGCKDEGEGKGRGLFTETLRSDLREIRSTLEAYMAQATIAGKDEASACGLGMSSGTPWNLTLRVTSEAGTAEYLIDRAD